MAELDQQDLGNSIDDGSVIATDTPSAGGSRSVDRLPPFPWVLVWLIVVVVVVALLVTWLT